MIPGLSKAAVFHISEKSAFKKVEQKEAGGIQKITVTLKPQAGASYAFAAKVLVMGMAEVELVEAAKKLQQNAVLKGILKKEELYARVQKKVKFAEGEA